MTQRRNRKGDVLNLLYRWCRYRGNLVFDNDEVRRVCDKIGFGNQFDVTKLDNSADLPSALAAEDVFVVHLGTPERRRGERRQPPARHQFVHGIFHGYHEFEPIPEERRYQWLYRRSILNNINTSESNILSVGYNQRIIHDFLYDDITASPKVYGSNRTRIPLDYRIGQDRVSVYRVQIEIDLTLEYLRQITVFEAKNGFPRDFNVFQLFNPFRYYLPLTQTESESLVPPEERPDFLSTARAESDISINCCYLLRQDNRLRLYLYSFDDPQNPGSIRLERNAEYTLVPR